LTARYAIDKTLSVEGRVNNLFDKNYEWYKATTPSGFNAFVGIRYPPQ
jgi:outer membrane cobalamin receptor